MVMNVVPGNETVSVRRNVCPGITDGITVTCITVETEMDPFSVRSCVTTVVMSGKVTVSRLVNVRLIMLLRVTTALTVTSRFDCVKVTNSVVSFNDNDVEVTV